MNTYRRLPTALTALQAAENAPALAQLGLRIQQSSQRLSTVAHLLPHALRDAIKAGPIDDKSWCLLVASTATAAKLRQLLPIIERRLALEGHKPLTIRLKIMVINK